MKRVVLALASNERYFPGLYCAVASTLSHLDMARELNLKVFDGGVSQASKDRLERLVNGFGKSVRLELLPIDESVFRGATLGPGQSHMAYCRILLPHLLDVSRLIYLDCDVLVFRDLSELFDIELACGKIIAAVRDSETSSLAEDSRIIADAVKVPPEGTYFSSGVMLMNLDELRRQHFSERAVEFLNMWKANYRFHDQSAINFLLQGQIEELPEYWNRASWRFDAQQNNDLDCVLHYTSSAPWLGGTRGPAQVLFERFAVDAGLSVDRQTVDFKKSRRQRFLRNALAPFRALAFPLVSLFYKIVGRKEKCSAYQKSARYWHRYILNAPRRRRLYSNRAEQIQGMKFKLSVSKSLA